MITMMKIMMMRTTMTNNNVPKNKRRNGIATNGSGSVCVCRLVCLVVVFFTHRQCRHRHRLRHRHLSPTASSVAPCWPAVKSINAMSRHKRMRVEGKPTDLLEVLGEVEPGSFEDVFIFGGRREIRWKNMRKNKPTLFSFRFCCFTLFSFSVFAIVRQENVTYGLVCYGLSRCLSPCEVN